MIAVSGLGYGLWLVLNSQKADADCGIALSGS